MNDGPGLDLLELRRRLTDLADSVEAEQPWDDPMPLVIAATATIEREQRPRRNPGPFTVVRGRVSRISWPNFNPVPIISVAAAVVVVALIGVLLHGLGGSAAEKSAAGLASTSAAAGAAAEGQPDESHSAPGSGAPAATRAPGPRAPSCATVAVSSRVKLSAPGQLVQGGVIRVRVATSGGLRLTSPTILVQSSREVVGRLVPTVVTPSPSSGSASFVITGRLVRTATSCGDLPGNTVPAPLSPRSLLPVGRYLLVVTGSTGAAEVASAPIVITVHR